MSGCLNSFALNKRGFFVRFFELNKSEVLVWVVLCWIKLECLLKYFCVDWKLSVNFSSFVLNEVEKEEEEEEEEEISLPIE